ncbi:hypothetical protein KGA66_25140 [Actinocrinis puniceicyclus]|uniref:Uncharacterized protein n=1 Tax=Actinocrinis puniceicyclus TaxID=977794 RepID=A0A8J8BEG3_9ACTN|nr:hypothetical protein [Actinocrinis puniceicyclus]MBS2966353.1 hypothetical protein [Actinocrinis puniceicyclus]
MTLDPPMEVVQFLQFIGIDWPMINEDAVREVAGYIEEFAGRIEQAHQDATMTIRQMGTAYQGASYELLAQRWAQMSSRHERVAGHLPWRCSRAARGGGLHRGAEGRGDRGVGGAGGVVRG